MNIERFAGLCTDKNRSLLESAILISHKKHVDVIKQYAILLAEFEKYAPIPIYGRLHHSVAKNVDYLSFYLVLWNT